MKLLERTYLTHSRSGNEKNLSSLVQARLDKLGIAYKVDDKHQVYAFNDRKPMLCAHLDQVQQTKCDKVIKHAGKLFGLNAQGQCGLGADNKNGVWIVIKLLEFFPDLSFIFSTEEEIGGNVYRLLGEAEQYEIPYCLVFDRKGKGDIIGTHNNYCRNDLQKIIAAIGIDYGYTPTLGVYSDCDAISEYIPCVNLSCGYYNAHSDKEHTVIKDLYNALRFGKALIEQIPIVKYKVPVVNNYRQRWIDYYRTFNYQNTIDCLYYDKAAIYIEKDLHSLDIVSSKIPKNGQVIDVFYYEHSIVIRNDYGILSAYIVSDDGMGYESIEIVEL